jgi:hypothetical protein
VHTEFWWGNLREGDYLDDPDVDGRIILKRILDKWDGRTYWIDLAQDRDRLQVAGSFECRNSDSIKCGEFLE